MYRHTCSTCTGLVCIVHVQYTVYLDFINFSFRDAFNGTQFLFCCHLNSLRIDGYNCNSTSKLNVVTLIYSIKSSTLSKWHENGRY